MDRGDGGEGSATARHDAAEAGSGNGFAALAFVLARRLIALGQLDLNDYGERADYRSPSAECVMEVSGTKDISELGCRHREKVAQALANPYGWDACVIVCAFSARGHRIRVSRHGPVEA